MQHHRTKLQANDWEPWPRFSLRALLLAVAVISVYAAAISRWELWGLALTTDAMLLGMAGIRYLNNRGFKAILSPRITVVEWIVLIVICLMLHGLALPAVTFSGHRRTILPSIAPGGPVR